MHAVVRDRFGPPETLRYEEVPDPAPGPGEALIRVRAAAVTAGDVTVRSLRGIPPSLALPVRLYFGLLRPRHRVLGISVAGVVESLGEGVDRFAVGEAVFGSTGMGMGAYAELVRVPIDAGLARKPEGLSFEEAAPIAHGAQSAWHFLRRGNVGEGDSVLINGASGGVGIAAVQLARHLGAEITATCSRGKAEFVRGLGAHRVHDYAEGLPGGEYDVILDAHGSISWRVARRRLRPGGRLLSLHFGAAKLAAMAWASLTTDRSIISEVAKVQAEDLEFLASLAERGELRSPIDRVFALEETAEAHRYAESGRAMGGIVVAPAVE